MDTETLTITKINEDNYQLITVHDQTGSAASINLSKSCYEQLCAHFVWEGKTLNDASALPIPDVSNCVRTCLCQNPVHDIEDASMCGNCGNNLGEHCC